MKIQVDYINIKIPILRFCLKKVFPDANAISVGSLVMTNNCLDIGLVVKAFNGKPTKILAKCSNTSLPVFYGSIETVKWYDTRIQSSITEWINLSKRYDAENFYKYWKRIIWGKIKD